MRSARPDDSARTTFEITHDSEPSNHLVAGFSTFGLAGLTAVDYLTDQLALEETGYITTDVLPPITPFESGTPHHHTRLFSRSDLEVTVLMNELFVPPSAAAAFADAILDWTSEHDVREISILSGVPVPHGPDEHRVFYVATEDYQHSRLGSDEIPPMGKGFLDGINATLVGRGMDTDLRVGVIVTPVHAQAPDAEAALRLVTAIDSMLDVDIDTASLEAFAANVQQYYENLAAHLEQIEDDSLGEDRMYM